MFLRRIGIAGMAFCLTMPAWAGEKRAEPAVETSRTARPAAAPVKASLSTSTFEVFKNVTIAPGQSVSLDSGIDYSATDRVAVTYRTVSGGDMSTMYIYAYWGIPIADSFGVAEEDNGSNFPFTNAGGEVFTVYGNQLQLRLENRGKTTIILTQVTLYIRSL
jgi:hypothetical protein